MQKTQNNNKPIIKDPLEAVKKGEAVINTLAPAKIEVDFNHIKIDDVYYRTIFVAGYPRFVSPGWMDPIINFNHSLDISFYIYPVEGRSVLDDLRRKITEMEAEISTDIQRGRIVNPGTQAKLEDAKMLQKQLVKGAERFFEFSFYITIPATSLEKLNSITKRVESTLGSILVVAKNSTLEMDKGFLSTSPLGKDMLSITRNMDTSSLATTFPFTTAELSSDSGVLYGINSQNDSFVIFDRFELENSNMCVFATSGAGKSLSYDEPVLYQNEGGETKCEKIGTLVEEIMKFGRVERIEKEIEGVKKPNIKVYAFNEELKGGWSDVLVAARKISPKKMFKVKTWSGREVKITPDHCLVVLKDGKVQAVRGDTVSVGDYVPLPRKIYQEERKLKSIDAFELLKKSRIKYLKKTRGRVGNRLFSKKTSIPAKFPVTREFVELLGYFAAEGTITPTKALISNHSKKVLSFVEKYYKSIDLSYSYAKVGKKMCGIYVSAQAFVEFLTLLGVSGKAHDKRVPPMIFSMSDKLVSKYLRAYFEGDGGVEKHCVSATTKSKGLASDISYLLLRFGIVARIKKTKKHASNTKHKRKQTYYRVTISGQRNVRLFLRHVGFVSERKSKLLRAAIKDGNTNVDVVPEIEGVFEEIYDVLYSSSEIPAPRKFSEIKLGTFRPSRENLLDIVEQIEKRVCEFENLEANGLSTLRKLPTVEEIVKRGRSRKANQLLWKSLGKSWSTMRKGIPPKLKNTLFAIQATHQLNYSQEYVGGAIYSTFKQSGESLALFDRSLWSSLMVKDNNPQYYKIIEARNYIDAKYKEKKKKLKKVRQKVEWLKTLAKSDLFWDPIVEIKETSSKREYVYDLQVKDGVFLAGHAGLFVHNSFFVKLESVRSLMLGTQVLVIDPENEYQALSEAVGGEYISFSSSNPSKINPFDLSQVREEGEDSLGLKILSLHSLFKVIMGKLTPSQEALLDKAIVNAYRAKGITPDPSTQGREPPLIEDLYKALIGMETKEAQDLAARIERFVMGSHVGMFDQHTNIDITNPFTVFNIRDVSDTLRPIVMFIIIDYIWTKIRRDIRKRLLIVDEAWHMMRYEDTAQFLWSIVKRARKYYLGLTTITQDVEDFLSQDIGKAVVTNSALRLLLKQSPAAIDVVGKTFYLSQGEKQLLLAANIGEGILFAGPHHAPIKIVASRKEYDLITTKPQEVYAQSHKKAQQTVEFGGQQTTPFGTAKITESRNE